MNMAGIKKTYKMYQLLVNAYREKPGNVTHASKMAGCGRRVARNAWETGWRKGGYIHEDLQPIQQMIEAENIRVRDLASERTEEEAQLAIAEAARASRLRANNEAVEQKTNEQKIASASLAVAAGLLPAMSEINRRMTILRNAVDEQISYLVSNKKMTIDRAMKLLKDWVLLAKYTNDTVVSAVDLSRKVAGEPDTVVEVTGGVQHDVRTQAVEELFGGDKERVIAATMSLVQGNMNDDARELLRYEQRQAKIAAEEAEAGKLH